MIWYAMTLTWRHSNAHMSVMALHSLRLRDTHTMNTNRKKHQLNAFHKVGGYIGRDLGNLEDPITYIRTDITYYFQDKGT